jgi:hypothetical protein
MLSNQIDPARLFHPMLVPVTIDTAIVPMNIWSIPAYFFIKFKTLLFLHVYDSYFFFIKFRTLLSGSALYCPVQNIIVSAQLYIKEGTQARSLIVPRSSFCDLQT